MPTGQSTGIGTLSEKSLHATLKEWYAKPGDEIEARVDGYVIDLVRGDELIEIQTKNFSSMRKKLSALLENYSVRLVHPIPECKWIVRQNKKGAKLGRRKSPTKGSTLHIFHELVHIPQLVSHPNLRVEVLITHEEVIWRDDGRGSWRRKRWSIHDRQLLKVVDRAEFGSKGDYRKLIPKKMAKVFTNQELAEALGCQRHLAGRITYTLRKAGLLSVTGKRGNAFLHELVN